MSRDSERYTKWHTSERSHARMLRFDWLIRRVGSWLGCVNTDVRARGESLRPRLVSPRTLCTTSRRDTEL